MLDKLPEDLRQMDEKQFLEAVEWLKSVTNGFKQFPEELFVKNNQLILILRLALGMTRPTFARKVGLSEETLRHVEAGRKQNQIKSLGVAKRWCEKINRFLNSLEIKPNAERALVLFREFSRKQCIEVEDKEKIAEKLKQLNLPEDPTQMSKKEVELLFNFLKEETDNFTKIPVGLLVSNSKLLIFSIRCLLGVTQKEFARMLEVEKDWIRHLENGREKIVHLGPALRWIPKLEKMLKGKQFSFSDFLKNFQKIALRKREETISRPSFRNLSTEEFLLQFRKLREETDNFAKLTEAIVEDPRRIFILRVMLLLRARKLAEAIETDRKLVTAWEEGKRKIRWETAEKISKFCEEALKNKKIDEKELVENFKIIKSKINPDREKIKIKAFKTVEQLPPTKLEKKVEEILTSLGIPFKLHATLKTEKIMMNVDFAIPNEKEPRIIIEVFETDIHRFSNTIMKAVMVDHRFQHIKRSNSSVITIMIAEFKGEALALMKKEIEAHLLNTDVFIESSELEKLKEILYAPYA